MEQEKFCFDLDQYSNCTFKELVDKIVEEKEYKEKLNEAVEILKKQMQKEFDTEINKMEQGIKMLEELGYVKNNTRIKWQIRFQKKIEFDESCDYDILVLTIEKDGFQKWMYESKMPELITLEEAKACIMIMEAMKDE